MSDFIAPAEVISVARRGMISGNDCVVDAKVADTDMPAGVLVSAGANQYGCKLPAAAADVTTKALGVTTYLALREPNTSNEYLATDVVNFLKNGEVWGIVEGAVTEGNAVYARISSSANGTQLGAFRADADTISTVDHATLVPNAKFKTTTTGAGVAKIGVVFT